MKKPLQSVFIIVLLIFSAAHAQAQAVPSLVIPLEVPAEGGGSVTIPVNYIANGYSISAVIFSVDYDENFLDFDPTDGNGDGIPDSITFNVSPFVHSIGVSYDPTDMDGELDLVIFDISLPFTPLPDVTDPGFTLMTITFNAHNPAVLTEVPVNFSQDPIASFGTTAGQDPHGVALNGSVLITPDLSEPVDDDGDGYPSDIDCDDNDSSVYPDADEICDGLDNNCDDIVPSDEVDADSDDFMACAECDDSDQNINPDAFELPGNWIDENCDGSLGECDPTINWKNHGQFVRCVAHETDALIAQGVLTEEEGDALISSAAQSDVGKK